MARAVVAVAVLLRPHALQLDREEALQVSEHGHLFEVGLMGLLGELLPLPQRLAQVLLLLDLVLIKLPVRLELAHAVAQSSAALAVQSVSLGLEHGRESVHVVVSVFFSLNLVEVSGELCLEFGSLAIETPRRRLIHRLLLLPLLLQLVVFGANGPELLDLWCESALPVFDLGDDLRSQARDLLQTLALLLVERRRRRRHPLQLVRRGLVARDASLLLHLV
mmetsp:Transcript_42429/g.99828  ORF Transcript_42429/g.99828 Transcript_42429/m.99828 type:complete len:221 (+) Transcript_42429:89-751(+)